MKQQSQRLKYIVGIDEAGRGPLAGPVAVGVCLVPININRQSVLSIAGINKLKDSKKLSEKMRARWFYKMQTVLKDKKIRFAVTLVSSRIIDSEGLSFAIRLALARSLKKINADPNKCAVLLDGGLKAPAEFLNQKTIVKGDEKEFSISLASIAAKVRRDRYMVRLGKKYPAYSFEIHKGYGTQRHFEAIKKHGLSLFHRRSFSLDLYK